ncbi:MAG: hypothetical protein KF809_16230 [Chloroflexi bacterium]|nr:hypothetical protein [Chloroflexota bacterium]
MFRRLSSIALAATVALGAAAPALAQDIGSFTVVDAPTGASVALHAEAQAQEQTDPSSGIVIRFHLAVTGEIASTLSAFEISEATGGYDIDLGVEGSAAGTGGTLDACTPLLHQGFPARDFHVAVTDPGGNQGTLWSRLVYTGEHVIQVQALGSLARAGDVDAIFGQLVTTLDIPPTAGPSPVPGASPVAPAACLVTLPGASPAPLTSPAG